MTSTTAITVPTNVTAATFDVDDFRTRYNALLADMGTVLFERPNEVKGIGLAALGKLNMFMVGAPGLAKSYLPRQFVSRLAMAQPENFFDVQINRTTVPEELLGPMSLKALEQDRYERNPSRRLPQALIALLDEFFKGSSSILNVGLKIMEERMWDNNGMSIPVPLWFVIAPSNECPTDAEFAAVSDRLPLRFKTEGIKDDSNFGNMLRMAANRHVNPTPQQFVSIEEIEIAQTLVLDVEVPDAAIDSLTDLRRTLNGDGIINSDRRFVKALQVLRTHAFLEGRTAVSNDDFRMLQHVLWTNPEHIRTVAKHVLDLANPLDREAADLLELIESLSSTYDRTTRDAATHEEKVRHTLEAYSNLREITERHKTVQRSAKDKSYSSDMLTELQNEIKKVAAKLKSGFGMPDVDLDDD